VLLGGGVCLGHDELPCKVTQSLQRSRIKPPLARRRHCSAAAITGEYTNFAAGYIFLSILSAATYTVVSVVVPLLHAKEMTRRGHARLFGTLTRTSFLPFISGLVTAIPVIYAAIRYPAYAEHVFHWNSSMLTIHWSWRSLL